MAANSRPSAPSLNQPARNVIDFDPDLERAWFNRDRDAVLEHIAALNDIIDRHAGELAMAATEGVFERTVSDKLSRVARSLRAVSTELADLHGRVARTNGYPRRKRASKL